MTVDASIPLQAKGSTVTAQGVVDTARGIGDIAIQKQQQRENEMKLEQQQNELNDKNALRDFDPSKYTDEDGNTNYKKMYSDVYRAAPSQAHDYINHIAQHDQNAAHAQQHLFDLEIGKRDKMIGLLGAYTHDPNANAVEFKNTIRSNQKKFGFNGEAIETELKNLPDDATPKQVNEFALKFQNVALSVKDQIEDRKSKPQTNVLGKVIETNPRSDHQLGAPIPGVPDQPTPTVQAKDAFGNPTYTTEGNLNKAAQSGAESGHPIPAGPSPAVTKHIEEFPATQQKLQELQAYNTQLDDIKRDFEAYNKHPTTAGPGSKLASFRDNLTKIYQSLGGAFNPNDDSATKNSKMQAVLGVDPNVTTIPQAEEAMKRVKMKILPEIYRNKALSNLGRNVTQEQLNDIDRELGSVDPITYQIEAVNGSSKKSRAEAVSLFKALPTQRQKNVEKSFDILDSIRNFQKSNNQVIVPAVQPGMVVPPTLTGGKK
jgi:hypothetical protein